MFRFFKPADRPRAAARADVAQPDVAPDGARPDVARAAPRGRTSDALDAELIARIAAGDLRAFETLYRAYAARVQRFLGLMTPRRAIVEEALNDTMLVVWKRAASFDGTSRVSTWILAIAYRTMLKAIGRADEPLADPSPDERPGTDAGPEQRHADTQRRAAIWRALEALSDEQRGVLVLTYFHDLPYAEIAQVMGCPVDTVKTRMFHARRRVRALLSGEPGDWL